MYTGVQHRRLMEGIELIRTTSGQGIIDLCIVSAGYGLLHEKEMIVPYEVTFNDMNKSEIREWARFLKIRESVSEKTKDYDLVVFLLGDKYLQALELPLDIKGSPELLFLASKTSRKLIPTGQPYYFVEAGKAEAKSFRYGLVGLKGYLFKLLAQEVAKKGLRVVERLAKDPNLLVETLGAHRKKIVQAEQLKMLSYDTAEKDGGTGPLSH